jgi:hypothetical protein
VKDDMLNGFRLLKEIGLKSGDLETVAEMLAR